MVQETIRSLVYNAWARGRKKPVTKVFSVARLCAAESGDDADDADDDEEEDVDDDDHHHN